MHRCILLAAIAVLAAAAFLSACVPIPPSPQPQDSSPQMANPASVNCEKQGGALSIETQPGGGQYGVCTFAGGKQCEEWALFRGACPVGGVELKGFATTPARYCAITGGTYTAIARQGAPDEQGTCKFANGKECAAAAYYLGTCTAD